MFLTTSVRWAGYAERLGEKIIAHITTDGISEDNKPLGYLNIQGGMVLNGYSRNGRFTLDWNFSTEDRDGAPVLENDKIM
jgi:flagellar basal body rod protein FlgG